MGHVQLTETERPTEAEIKIMAVDPPHQRRGIGRGLIAATIALARDEARSMLVVATAAADLGTCASTNDSGFGCGRSSATPTRSRSAMSRSCTSTASSCATGSSC